MTSVPMQRSINRPVFGIALMVAATVIFSVQDGVSRHLADQYNVMTIVMLRYWFFAALVICLALWRQGGIRAISATRQLPLQIARGVLLVAEICLAMAAFTRVGLVNFHAVFASYPLVLAALSAPLLGERVGWRRWGAITAGFVGIIIALNPTDMHFSWDTILPILCAVLFAIYGILTRLVAREDSAETSFFWTGISGAIAVTIIAPFFWVPPEGSGWIWMGFLCLTSATGHFLLIKALAVTEASTVQPFAYFSIVFASAVGVIFFDETVAINVVAGATLIVAAGLLTLQRERMAKAKQEFITS